MSSSQRPEDRQHPEEEGEAEEEEQQQQQEEEEEGLMAAYEEPPEEDDPNIVLNDLEDYRRMLLFDFERDCAEYIKERVEADNELDNLSDYQYVMFALLELERDENTDYTLERIRYLQEFKKEYKIQDTYQEGRRYMRQIVEMWPTHLLNIELNPENGALTVVANLKGVDNSVLKNNARNVNTMMCGDFYSHQAFAPDFRAQRQGLTALVEFQGFDWTKHLSYKMVRKLQDEIMKAHPAIYRKTIPHNVGFWANLIISAFRKISPEILGENFRVNNNRASAAGVVSSEEDDDNTSLDALYLQPNPEDAKERVIKQFDEFLKRRYKNEKEFSL